MAPFQADIGDATDENLFRMRNDKVFIQVWRLFVIMVRVSRDKASLVPGTSK